MSRVNRPARSVPGVGGSGARATPAGAWSPAPGARRLRTPPRQGYVMSEEEFQARIIDYCRLRGLTVFHERDSRRNNPGWPDLTIMGTDRVIFRELKTDVGKLRPEQETCIATMRAAGLDVAVWRPSDWLDHIVPQLDAVKRPRLGDT